MKKTFKTSLLAVCTTLLAVTGYGQSPVGAKAGINLSTAAFDQSVLVDNSQIKAGFYAGALVNINLSRKLFMQPELLYSLKGWYSDANGLAGSKTVNLHYLNLPVLLGYRPINNLSILAGPEIGFLIQSNALAEGFDVGVDLGAVYRLSRSFGVEVRYNYGLGELFEVTTTDATGAAERTIKDGRNRVLHFGVFYMLPKK